jgi:peptidoglycan hydrolase-like protein with peptidoglycan-binding domain
VVISVAILLVVLLALSYVLDAQRRERLLNAAATPDEVRLFLARNTWHPIAGAARDKLAHLDDMAWNAAGAAGTIEAVDAYLAAFPAGAHHHEAETAKIAAERVREIQSLLARLGRYSGGRNGALDAETRGAIKTFQFERGMVVTGTIDEALAARLAAEIGRFTKVDPGDLVAKRTGPPTLEEYRDIAARLGVDAPTLEAVRQTETSQHGFDSDGRPTILFERHIFSRLTHGRFDMSHPQVSANQPGGYGPPGGAQWSRLKEAYALDPEAAYEATSFGMFQILGGLHKEVGFETVAEYARFVSQSEANQVEVFARFVEHGGLLAPLRCLDWVGFARRYNGPNFRRNHYDERLRAAYLAAAAKFGVEAPSARTGCK